jgi:hypothetical protein
MLTTFDGRPRSLQGVAKLWPRYYEPLHRLFQRPYLRFANYPNADRYIEAGRAIAARQGRAFDLDMLRQSLTLAFCDAHGAIKDGAHCIVIGDGFAALGSILVEALPGCKVSFVNIAPLIAIDRMYFERAHPIHMANFIDATDFETIPQAHLSIDIACMGEINPDVCDRYCQIRAERCSYSYSCNRVEKMLPDGTVTRFSEYAWPAFLKVLVDEPCPWHQTFYSFRPPFRRKYDGPFQHKLLAR